MGVWVAPDGQVGLGHRRLAIIDLTPTPSGVQPMSDANGRIWLTYNGEIYNHAELRRDLEALGHRFRSAGSDSEVIIYAYRSGVLMRFSGSAGCLLSRSGMPTSVACG